MTIRAVTVYCSSSNKIPRIYADAAAELGRAIASNGWTLVYGGNCVGCMMTLADATRAAGGKVVGVTPKLFVDKGIVDQKCAELIVTDGMRDRKAVMEERGDAFIALPGGLGTFEEIFEIICGKQLDYHNKPIVLLNIDNYYAPLIAMIDHGVEQNFIKPKARDLYFVAKNVPEAIDHIRRYHPPSSKEKSFEASAPPSSIE